MRSTWVERNDPDEWTERATPDKPDFEIADCGSEESHRIRLEAILKLPFETGDTLVELGCGTGALADLVPPGVHYSGFDFSEGVVAEARRRRPETEFVLGGVGELVEADWLVANGPFSYSQGWSKEETYLSVERMWALSRRGVSITFLVSTSPEVPRLNYSEEEIAALTRSWEYEHLEIDRSYLPNDMCLRAWRAR